MPNAAADWQLLQELYKYRGNMRGVKDALEAGASVDGDHELPYRPLMVAANSTDGKMVKFLVKSGADLEATTWRDENHSGRRVLWKSGSRAVHSAVHGAKIDNLRVLLEAGANPNATDSIGCTPLMAVFLAKDRPGAFAMVKELLKAGADPELVAQDGKVALHLAAGQGATHDVLSMLTSPATLDHSDNNGPTPLYYAACEGHEGAVAWLLASGASDMAVLHKKKNENLSSLLAAVNHGKGRVVRTILNEGMEAVRGMDVIPFAIVNALKSGKVRLLQMLLATEGAERALRFGCGDGIGILLSSIGDTDADKKAATRRILERAPACRARSWAWPTKAAGPGVSVAIAPVNSPLLGVSLVRPRNETFFTVRLARYCAKK